MFGKEDSSSHRPRYTSKSASGLMAEWRSARLAFAMAAAFAIALFGMIYLFGPGEHEATPAFAQVNAMCPAIEVIGESDVLVATSEKVYASGHVDMTISWVGVDSSATNAGNINSLLPYQVRWYDTSGATPGDDELWFAADSELDGIYEKDVPNIRAGSTGITYKIQVRTLCTVLIAGSPQQVNTVAGKNYTTVGDPEPCNGPSSFSLSSRSIQLNPTEIETTITANWGAVAIPAGHNSRYENYEIRFKRSTKSNFSNINWDSVAIGTETYDVPDDYEAAIGTIELVIGDTYDFELRVYCREDSDDYYSEPTLEGTITAADIIDCLAPRNLQFQRRAGGFYAEWETSSTSVQDKKRYEYSYKKTSDADTEFTGYSGTGTIGSVSNPNMLPKNMTTITGLDDLTFYDLRVRLKCKTEVEDVFLYSPLLTGSVKTEATRLYTITIQQDGDDIQGRDVYEGEIYVIGLTMEADQPVYDRDVDMRAEFTSLDDEDVVIVDGNSPIPASGATNIKFATSTLQAGQRYVSWGARFNCDGDTDPDDIGEAIVMIVQPNSVTDGAIDTTSDSYGAVQTLWIFEVDPCVDDAYTPGNRVATGSVSISGTLAVGEVLTANHTLSDLNGLPSTFNYQWLREGVDIDSETSRTYTIKAADAGTDILVVVSFTDLAGFNESIASTAVRVPSPGANSTGDVNIGNDFTPDMVNGRVRAELHRPLSAEAMNIHDPDGTARFAADGTYSWHSLGVFQVAEGMGPYPQTDQVDRWDYIQEGFALTVSEGATYTPRYEDGLDGFVVGGYFVACYHFQDDAGTQEHLCSDPTTQVPYGPDINPVGARFVGETLTASTADMDYDDLPGTSYMYQWSREDENGVHDQDLGTDVDYVITVADIDKFINLHVMYINRFGDPITKQSNTRVGPVAPPLRGPSGLTASVSGGIVTLSWILPAGDGETPDGYEYCYTATAVNDCESSTASQDWMSVSALSVTIPGLINGAMYRFEVRSVGGVFTSDAVTATALYRHATRDC